MLFKASTAFRRPLDIFTIRKNSISEPRIKSTAGKDQRGDGCSPEHPRRFSALLDIFTIQKNSISELRIKSTAAKDQRGDGCSPEHPRGFPAPLDIFTIRKNSISEPRIKSTAGKDQRGNNGVSHGNQFSKLQAKKITILLQDVQITGQSNY